MRLSPFRFFSATVVEIAGALAVVWMLPQVDWQSWTSQIEHLAPQAMAQTASNSASESPSNWIQLPTLPEQVPAAADRNFAAPNAWQTPAPANYPGDQYQGPVFPAPVGSDPWSGNAPITSNPWQDSAQQLPSSVAGQYAPPPNDAANSVPRQQYVEQRLEGVSQRLISGITGYFDSTANQILQTEEADQRPSLNPRPSYNY